MKKYRYGPVLYRYITIPRALPWADIFWPCRPSLANNFYDIQGRMVDKRHYSMLKSGQEVVLPLNAYGNGVYTIRIKTSKSDTARKLMR